MSVAILFRNKLVFWNNDRRALATVFRLMVQRKTNIKFKDKLVVYEALIPIPVRSSGVDLIRAIS